MTRTLALVESPAQLLNVAEWAYFARQGEGAVRRGENTAVQVAVLLPMDPWSRVQLARVAELTAGSGLDITRFEIRSGTVSRLRQFTAVRKLVARAERLVVGDLFSGMVQMLLPSATARELVIVDDGTATTEFVRIVTEGRDLTRWHQQAARAGRSVKAMGWLTAPSLRRCLFTCMEVAPPPGITIVPNQYAWTRSRFTRPVARSGADLLGTSLVETGIVGEERYLEAVRAIVRTRGVDRYMAHRRESREKLRRITESTGVTVLRPDLPLELLAAQGPIGHTVLTFPSTVAHTLPIVLRGLGIRVGLCEIDESWYTSGTTSHAVSFLRTMSESAKHRHGLPSIRLTAGATDPR
ncbi:hypothetical protein ACF09J_18410 [Streptomyces sp. NPDC014889]|uniref:hypothetical protein n=1 Tax=Streptomyces sp. NPDC014889 TaxID=3364928 RepID=UPI0036F8678D